MPRGAETHLRMPLADFDKLRAALDGAEFADATPMLRDLRMVKSEAEIEKIRRACGAASDAFAAAPKLFSAGMPETEVFRALKMECLRCGADDAPYLTGGAAPGGSGDVISPPTERKLRKGDILNLDLGCVWDGYFSDFNRNFSVGAADDETKRVYSSLHRAAEKGMAAANPGARCSDVFRAMAESLEADGAQPGSVGRMGHGVGMRLDGVAVHRGVGRHSFGGGNGFGGGADGNVSFGAGDDSRGKHCCARGWGGVVVLPDGGGDSGDLSGDAGCV